MQNTSATNCPITRLCPRANLARDLRFTNRVPAGQLVQGHKTHAKTVRSKNQ